MTRAGRWLVLILAATAGLADPAPLPAAPWYRINIYADPPVPARAERRPIIRAAAVAALKGQECGVGDARGTPLGETAFLRGTLDLRLHPASGRLHAAAQLSQDLPTAESFLAPELASDDSDRSVAAALTLAFVAAKSDPGLASAPSLAALERLERLMAEARRPCPDCDYLRAVRAWLAGDGPEALRLAGRAVDQEQRYFNALALRMILLTERLQGPAARDESACVADLRTLADTLLDLGRINPCPLQAGHLDLLVSRQFEHPESISAIWAMRLVLGAVTRNETVVAAALRALESADDLHPACRRQLLGDARRMLTGTAQ